MSGPLGYPEQVEFMITGCYPRYSQVTIRDHGTARRGGGRADRPEARLALVRVCSGPEVRLGRGGYDLLLLSRGEQASLDPLLRDPGHHVLELLLAGERRLRPD